MTRYALESEKEVERLEAQSNTEMYDFRSELRCFLPCFSGPVLDAGCGSGVVSRYLASQGNAIQVIGCDASAERIKGAKALAREIRNLEFVQSDLSALPFAKDYFGSAICRYVLEHLSPNVQRKAMSELFRVIRPGGWLCLIDIDGMYHNLFPKSALVDEVLKRLEETKLVDLFVGRKLHRMTVEAGFKNSRCEMEVMDFQGKTLEIERQLLKERLDLAQPFLSELMNSKDKAEAFRREFLAGVAMRGAVLFYNKFIVLAQKPYLELVGKS